MKEPFLPISLVVFAPYSKGYRVAQTIDVLESFLINREVVSAASYPSLRAESTLHIIEKWVFDSDIKKKYLRKIEGKHECTPYYLI
jgi:hypothetical protein